MKFFPKRSLKTHSDKELMLMVQNHHGPALDELYMRYQQKLLAFFYNALNRDSDKAKDFLQDLFLKVLDKATLFDLDRKFSTWLYTIASNMIKNEYRRLSIRNVVTNEFNFNMNDNAHETTINLIDFFSFEHHLAREIETLNIKHKTVIILRYQEELSLREISETLDISEGTVKSRLFYALKKLNNKLYEFDPKVN